MKLACSDYTFRCIEPWERALQGVRLLDIPAVDVTLMGGRSHLRPEVVLEDVPASARRINTGLATEGLEAADLALLPWPEFETMTGFDTMAPNHPDPEERRQARAWFEAGLELAKRIGSPSMTMLPGVAWPDESWEDSFDRCVEELAWRAEQSGAAGVAFGVEAHVGSIVEHPDAAERLCQEAAPLGLTLDYSHFVSLGHPQESLDRLCRFATFVHARAACRGRVQAPMRDSEIDFEAYVDALQAAGYDGFVGFEYVWIDGDYHLNDIDTLNETALIRDRLRAKFAGEPWEARSTFEVA